jgi:predicted DNA-binding transcriptional regulator YafY
MTKTELVQLLSTSLLQGRVILKRAFCSTHELEHRTFERAIKEIKNSGFELTRDFVDTEHGRTVRFTMTPEARTKVLNNKECGKELLFALASEQLFPTDEIKKSDREDVYSKASVYVLGMKVKVCPEVFEQVNTALRLRKVLSVLYRNREIKIHTLALYFRAGYWYLRMIEPNSTKIKTLRLDRIESCRFTGKKFGEISSYSLRDEQSRSFGRMLGYEPETARFWCEASLADYFSKHPLHESQVISQKSEQDATLELLYNSQTDLLRRVKVFIPSLIPLSPPALVSKYRSELLLAQQRLDQTQN